MEGVGTSLVKHIPVKLGYGYGGDYIYLYKRCRIIIAMNCVIICLALVSVKTTDQEPARKNTQQHQSTDQFSHASTSCFLNLTLPEIIPGIMRQNKPRFLFIDSQRTMDAKDYAYHLPKPV